MTERPRWLTDAARSGTDVEGPRASDPERARVAGGRRSLRRVRRPSKGRGRPAERRQQPGGDRTRSASGGEAIPSSQARFARRANQVRRRPWRLLAVVAAVLLVAAAAVWVVAFSALLATRTVTVMGLSDPGEQDAARQAAAIADGTPLARVDTSGAAERVGRIPTVASVTVSRSWPSTVVVSVQRKVPVLAVKNPQGQLQVVDVSGVPYEVVPALPEGIAEVNATSEAPDPEGIRAAIDILELLPAGQRQQVSGVTVTSADLVTFQLGDVRVVWGGVADGPKKLRVLETLLATNPGTIDVSAPDTPVTR